MSDSNEQKKRPKRPYEIRDLNILTRFALTILSLVLIGGLVVSGLYMRNHYENRDGEAGITLQDIEAQYHGVNRIAPMITVLEDPDSKCSAHEVLDEKTKQILLDWLQGDRISGEYDSLDLGDAAPAEIIRGSCLQCHSRNATQGGDIGKRVPLDYWDDVEKVAFSKQVEPTSPEVILTSMHTHSLSMSMILLITILLAIGTAWPRALVGLLVCLAAIGLAADFSCWFLARDNAIFIYGIVGGGILFAGGTTLTLLAVVLDLWRPRFR